MKLVPALLLPLPYGPLEVVQEVPLPGAATRWDYLSIDPLSHRLFLAHMGDGSVVAVDTLAGRAIAIAPGLPRVRGVLAVPALGKVYAAASGSGEVVAFDASTLDVLARIPAGNVDSLDYAPSLRRLFVTDQRGGVVVINVDTDQVLTIIPVGEDVGNTRYDPSANRVLVTVGATDELVAIDPASLTILDRYSLPGIAGAHGMALDPATHTAFIAGEENGVLCAFSLDTNEVTAVATVGQGVDVLDVDPGLSRLYVASESGVVSVFNVDGGRLQKVWEGFFADHAHVVGVDRSTHLIYFPLQNVNGVPILRILRDLGK